MPPAARISDHHACPMVTPGMPPIPHVGGPIAMGSANVLTGKLPQARVGDMAVCVGPPDVIVKGSTGVFVNNKPAARQGDNTAHGGVIVGCCPTVIIGEKWGGSGGGAGAGDGGLSMAYVDAVAQAMALAQAAMVGAPFVQPCFKGTVPPAPTAKTPSPPSAPAAKPPTRTAAGPSKPVAPVIGPSAKVCEITALTVQCSHGRKAGSERILGVVAGGAMWSDDISGTLSVKGGCGDHPAWTVSGALDKAGKGTSLSFGASSQKRQPSPHVTVTPTPDHSVFAVNVHGCSTNASGVQVLAYPPEETSLAIDLTDSIETIKDFFTRTGASKDNKFQFLHGSISVSSKWKEAKDWRCFMETKISGGFDPLLAGNVELPFYKPVPYPLSKVANIKAYVGVKGTCRIQTSLVWEHWPYPQPGGGSTVWKTNLVEGGGEFRFQLGARADAASEAIAIRVEGSTGGTIAISPAHKAYAAAKVEWALGDARVDISLTVDWPWAVEFKHSVPLWPGWNDTTEWRFDKTKA